MRIGLVAPPWLPVPRCAYGGTEAVVDTLARGYRASGHDVVLYTTGDSTCPVPRRSGRARAATASMNQTVPELAHVLRAYHALSDCTVVHDHTVAGPLVGSTRGGPPIVTTIHGDVADDLRDVYTAVGQRAAIVAVSESQRLRSDLEITRVIHHGIEPGAFEFGRRGGRNLLFLGRMAPEKGAQRAVEVARLTGRPLLMAGRMQGDDETTYFEECVRPALGPTIRYLGEVSPVAKQRLLRDAYALVNPIRWAEPFGLVMVEALASGTPVLTFAEGAAPEIVRHGETGFVCEDEADMAAHCERVVELDRRVCRRAVEGYFSAERMVSDYLDLFAGLVEDAASTVLPFPVAAARQKGA